MSLRQTLEVAKGIFLRMNAPYALIGGFALGAHGIARATADIDFLVDGSFRDEVIKQFKAKGFALTFDSKEILQFSGPGHVDVLLAQRPLSKEMIKNAKMSTDLRVPVAEAEDLIGLKIQAYCNDISREWRDKADIVDIIRTKKDLDWQKVRKYASLFQKEQELDDLRQKALS